MERQLISSCPTWGYTTLVSQIRSQFGRLFYFWSVLKAKFMHADSMGFEFERQYQSIPVAETGSLGNYRKSLNCNRWSNLQDGMASVDHCLGTGIESIIVSGLRPTVDVENCGHRMRRSTRSISFQVCLQ